jgi:hypothetical protein
LRAIAGPFLAIAGLLLVGAIIVLNGAAPVRAQNLQAFDQLNPTAQQAAKLLSRVHQQLRRYDRIVQMQVARGALAQPQANALLRRRADEFARGSAVDLVGEERQEAAAFFGAVAAAASSARWPATFPPGYYRALVAATLARARAEHAAALAGGKDTTHALDAAYSALALTQGRQPAAASPFANPHPRIFAAMEFARPPEMPAVLPPPSTLEFGVDRPGFDIANLTVAGPTQCLQACDNNSACRAFTFVNPGVQGPQARCWLKNVAPAPRANACCTSGVKVASRATPPVSPPPTTAMPAGRMLGCFRDTNAPFDLDGHLERTSQNTPQRCIAVCKAKGFRFAGVQYGQSCLCGNSYGRYGQAANCNMACTGNRAEICGGINSNNVYTTGL